MSTDNIFEKTTFIQSFDNEEYPFVNEEYPLVNSDSINTLSDFTYYNKYIDINKDEYINLCDIFDKFIINKSCDNKDLFDNKESTEQINNIILYPFANSESIEII